MYSSGFEEGGVKDGEIEEGQIGSCIIELNDYCCNRSCNTLADFLSARIFRRVFRYICIQNIAERINEAAKSEDRAAPQFCVLMSLIRRVLALHGA
jgi:hypothetical protein